MEAVGCFDYGVNCLKLASICDNRRRYIIIYVWPFHSFSLPIRAPCSDGHNTSGGSLSLEDIKFLFDTTMMMHLSRLIALISLCSAAYAAPETPATRPPAVVPYDYKVGEGDLLEISVWKEEGLTKQVMVRPDGGLTFPLVGDVQAGGMTVDQITDELIKRLSNYMSDPAVNVAVVTVNQKVYVVGKVNKPGDFTTPARIDVMQALAMAGGLTPFADADDIKIIRREHGREITFSFDYDEVTAGESLEQNIVLQRGDVVVVP